MNAWEETVRPMGPRLTAPIAIIIVAFWGIAHADDSTFIRVSQIDGLLAPNVLVAGDTVRFYITYGNRSQTHYNVSNGFKVYSRESLNAGSPGSGTAEWTTPLRLGRDYTDSVCESGWPGFSNKEVSDGLHAICNQPFMPRGNFPSLYVFPQFSFDGRGADTIALVAATDLSHIGLPPADSGVAFVIWFVTRRADSGKVICLDSTTYFGATNRWRWGPVNAPAGTPNAFPSWSGPHCFELAALPCCQGQTGNVDCDPEDAVDVSDLTALIDNLFMTSTPLCCPEEANIDGQPGIDISDLSLLIDFLYVNFTPPAVCQ